MQVLCSAGQRGIDRLALVAVLADSLRPAPGHLQHTPRLTAHRAIDSMRGSRRPRPTTNPGRTMIITDNFVMLAFPKTGTTYTTTVLRRIHARRSLRGWLWPLAWQKRDFPRPGYREHRVLLPAAPPYHKARMSRHGTWNDIPEADRHKPVVSICRDPFSRYTSAYLFQTRMRKHQRTYTDLDVLCATYPGYPDISFRDYYDLLHRFEVPVVLGGIKPSMPLGSQSATFIRFYFRDPEAVFRRISRAYIEDKAYREDMVDVHFLRQENLREEFMTFLGDMGYSERECQVAQELKQKNVAQRKGRESRLSHFYDDALRQEVLARDALLFDLFPEYAADWERD